VPPVATTTAVGPEPATPAVDAGSSSRIFRTAKVVVVETASASVDEPTARGLGKAARVVLVAVVALVAVVGVRAVTLTGGAVPTQDHVGVETLVPEFPSASDPGAGVPQTNAPAGLQEPSQSPVDRHQGSGTSTTSNGSGSSGTGGNAGNGNGGGGSTPGGTPSPGPTATPTPTDPSTPQPTDPPTLPPTDPPTPPPTDPPTPDPPTPDPPTPDP
jgi:uncharacterized membrane protein YgcG